MLRFHWPNNGGDWWQWPVKETGQTIKANNWAMLQDRVRQHLDANGHQDVVIDPDALMDHAARIASQISPGCCFEHEDMKPQNRRLALGDVIRFSRTMLLNLAKGLKRVEQAEADRRGAICANCIHNVTPGGCGGCAGSGVAAATIGLLVGERKTAADAKLQSCQFCGCFNKAQVWFPLEDLQGGMTKTLRAELPDHCWKK